jgi:diacylglycerol kinase
MGGNGLRKSFACAFNGIAYTVWTGKNMKIHIAAALAVILSAYYLGFSRHDWVIIILTIFLVLMAETVNTAIETTVDLYTREYSPLARIAKNAAAGGVLLTAVGAVIIAVLVYGPYLSRFWGGYGD